MFLASVSAALIYEVVWFHLVRFVIGASAPSLCILLAGSRLGSALFGHGIWGIALRVLIAGVLACRPLRSWARSSPPSRDGTRGVATYRKVRRRAIVVLPMGTGCGSDPLERRVLCRNDTSETIRNDTKAHSLLA
ncbi:MAG TPA: hypothetical protein VJT73_18060 [Polyangiaceae bacterium]|nr:hypothetical protein [Polyangiaceae bacterium]